MQIVQIMMACGLSVEEAEIQFILHIPSTFLSLTNLSVLSLLSFKPHLVVY